MSEMLIVHSPVFATKQEIYQAVIDYGGHIDRLSNGFEQGNISKAGSVFWVYYREKPELDDETVSLINERYGFKPAISVALDMARGNRTIREVVRFGKYLMGKYPGTILDDDRGHFYSTNELDGIERQLMGG